MKLNRRNMLQGTALVFAGGAGYSLFGSTNSSTPSIVSTAHAEDFSELNTPSPMGEMFLGEEDAPVTIIEYASMTCPHCSAFHAKVLPSLKEKYIETGKLKLIFREFPLDPRAFAGSMLARCAPKEFYFPMVDVLFKQQSQWSRAADPRPPLLQIAKLAGFTQESFEACLKNQEILDNINKVKNTAANQFGVNSTPYFFINEKKYDGKYTVDAMSKAIDALL
ncbi:MAG: disulfide bond formation protein DsbA [Hyphomicrobiales bacterium]|nr:MAG: disulfide bond formation protein DsbA [Hyphomicrobiales bacterium]